MCPDHDTLPPRIDNRCLVRTPTANQARTAGGRGERRTDELAQHLPLYPSSDGFVFSMAEGGTIRHRNFYRRHFRPAVAATDLVEGHADDLMSALDSLHADSLASQPRHNRVTMLA